MKTLKTPRFLAILGLAALVACEQDQNPAAPEFDELLTLEEEVELTVLADASSVETAIELAAAGSAVASRRGRPGAADSHPYAERARIRFQNAQDALARGDRRAAVEEGRQARRLVVAGVQAAGGETAVRSLVDRIEDLSIAVADAPEDFVDAQTLSGELLSLAQSANSALDRGDLATAGERAVLGEQRARRDRGRDGRRGDVGPDRAEVEIGLAASAITLAERLLESGATDEQIRFLETAKEFLAKAREAFDSGDYGRAVHAAHAATWHALRAVISEGGLTTDDLREILDLAKELYPEAQAAVGDGGTELEVALLERAGRLIEVAESKFAEGHPRGVGPAWRSAVISSYLIG